MFYNHFDRFSLLVYENKYYLQAYLHNSTYKIIDKIIKDYLDDHLFHSDWFFNSDK